VLVENTICRKWVGSVGERGDGQLQNVLATYSRASAGVYKMGSFVTGGGPLVKGSTSGPGRGGRQT